MNIPNLRIEINKLIEDLNDAVHGSREDMLLPISQELFIKVLLLTYLQKESMLVDSSGELKANNDNQGKETTPETEKVAKEITETFSTKSLDFIENHSIIKKELGLTDLFGEQIETLSEIQTPTPLNRKVQQSPILDIRSAIGINDKFRFVNELFGENMQEYSVAIQELNSSSGLDAAMTYVEKLRNIYNWDMEAEIIKRLLELIERRYP